VGGDALGEVRIVGRRVLKKGNILSQKASKWGLEGKEGWVQGRRGVECLGGTWKHLIAAGFKGGKITYATGGGGGKSNREKVLNRVSRKTMDPYERDQEAEHFWVMG